MSAPKHTPGPWSYRPHEDDDWGIVRAPVIEQGQWMGGIICQARDPEALGETTLAKHRADKTDPWEANARLIAAAPELLKALESAVECGLVPISSAKDGGANKHSRQVQVADMIRAAIAKARGAA